MNEFLIRVVNRADEVETCRKLFLDYASSLDFELCFQNFEAELAGLPGAYASPTGRLLLASCGDQAAGCVAFRPIGDATCEMKRLWVDPAFRGTGLGKQLAQAAIEQARQIGYRRMRLDTVPSMSAAIRLYESLGFQPIEPYTTNPVPGAIFMELDLSSQ